MLPTAFLQRTWVALVILGASEAFLSALPAQVSRLGSGSIPLSRISRSESPAYKTANL